MLHSKLIHDFLADSAIRFPEKDSVFFQGRWHTYSWLDQQANQMAHLLIELGLKKGQRVGLLLENSPEYVVSYYGILKAGGITVALNTENTVNDFAYIAHDCCFRFMITSSRFVPKVTVLFSEPSRLIERLLVWSGSQASVSIRGTSLLTTLPAALSEEPKTCPSIRVIDLDVASIVYTSGSTGKPRGATLSHLNIVSNTRSIVDYLELRADDRIMVVLPFYYIYGKSLLNTHVFVGGSAVIDNRFLYPNVILKTMQEQAATGFAGVPSTFSILLGRSNIRALRFPSLRYVTQAGGPMAPSVQREVADVFAPARLIIMYGATEASARLSYLDPTHLTRKWGSIGKAIPNVELFVADEDGHPLLAGEEGEIVARGSNLMSGYWNNREETDKVLRNGLYFTGDIGRADEEGFLYVVGRKRDMLKIGGNRVSAKEIEDVLYEHPGVAEAAVIGVPDEILGEAPKAFITIKSGFEDDLERLLIEHLKRRLAFYKVPRAIEIRSSLPKNEAGKIQKLKLS